MRPVRSKIFAAVALAFGVGTAGVLAFSSGGEPPDRPAAAMPPDLRSLLESRVEAERAFAEAGMLFGAVKAGVLAFSPGGEPPNRPAAAMAPAVRKLLEGRVEAARAVAEGEMLRLRLLLDGRDPPFETILAWSRRAMEDRLRLAADARERLDAIREHRRRSLFIEGFAQTYARSGQCRPTEPHRARYYRLEADQFLIEAGGDPSKEPAAEPGPNAPTQPTAPPPPAPR